LGFDGPVFCADSVFSRLEAFGMIVALQKLLLMYLDLLEYYCYNTIGINFAFCFGNLFLAAEFLKILS